MMNSINFESRDTLRKLLCMLCILSFGVSVIAQKRVSGTVIDVNDEPIIGVNVLEKGTSNGTVTGFDGTFSLTVAENATLQVSYIGYITQEISDLAGGGVIPL